MSPAPLGPARPGRRAVAGAGMGPARSGSRAVAAAGLRPAWPSLRAAAAPAALAGATTLAFVALAPDRWPGWAAALLAVPLVRLLDDPAGVLATASPTSLPRPSSTLTTPPGRPASCSASVTTCACKGPSSLGLMTEAQPAAIAEASLLQMLPAAAFQGAMRPATPIGSIMTVASPKRRSKA